MTYRQEEIKPYRQDGEKSEQVEQMFDNIAPTYDTLNHRLSWNIDRSWRRKAIAWVAEHEPYRVLDVASGTADFAIMTAKMLPKTAITGIDISEGMLAVGQEKIDRDNLTERILLQKEDCLNMTFEDGSFDTVISAFGIRNFSDLEKSLHEMRRVLCEGGKLCLLELTTPTSQPMKWLFRMYSHSVLPLYGKLISHDKAAYTYLTNTIEAFPQGEEMMKIFANIGFKQYGFKRLTFGICTMYYAIK